MKKKVRKKITGGIWRPVELRGPRPRGHVIEPEPKRREHRRYKKKIIEEALNE